jgi:pyruvate formate-lyase activating enzyme-like uncharacterized protein
MIIEIDRETLAKIKNPTFRDYASCYNDIYDDFLEQIGCIGVPLEEVDQRSEVEMHLNHLKEIGAHVRNDNRSVYINHISPACLACQNGLGSVTLFISLQCHRKCFYCFNPNQENYETYANQTCDLNQNLEELKRTQTNLKHLALTGGEPLLHKEKALEFFINARNLFPRTYTRLYTSGDHIDTATLAALKEAGLHEIRFSLRVEDNEKAQRLTFDNILKAKEYISYVMVEMPVLPGKMEKMKDIICELERIGIFSINLLEFCFPLHNADEYIKRGYSIKKPPYRVLYNYSYGGGLPVAQSELDCLELVKYALESNFKMGVHYCSLENKHSGQIYQQNRAVPVPTPAVVSNKDYFLKTAKVFGDDVAVVKERLSKKKTTQLTQKENNNYLEFDVRYIRALQGLDIEIGISTSILEQRGDEYVVRELKIDLTTPDTFNLGMDI